MMAFHFIRPLWFWLLVPLVVLVWVLFRQKPSHLQWSKVCDQHLLPYLLETKGHHRRTYALLLLFFSLLLMIISVSGPTWSKWPVPSYQQIQPRVLVLDMSDDMQDHDLTPDRLTRAKFKLHDLFQRRDIGQLGLVVYTGEPFVVSPLTDDGKTIDSLLSSLTPDIMPVEGLQLGSALLEASKLISQAGFTHGQILVMTASAPSRDAIATAKSLAQEGIHTSILPVLSANISLSPLFGQLATAGQGALIRFSDTSKDLLQWLAASDENKQFAENPDDDLPIWQDQGRWFLIPALFLLLPLFRRGFVERMNT